MSRPTVWLVGLALAMAGSSAAAAPCAGFTDVEDTSPFCPHVAWMRNRAITFGCTATTYCPNDPVTRLQMAAFMNRLGDSLFPLSCAAGQVMKWDGLTWGCANDNIGGGGGGGTVTSVAAGTGLQASPNPITGAGSINLAPSYQLPQACANGQVAKSNGAGGWTCAADANGGGTVTNLAAGAGITLAPNPIVGAGTVAADTTYLQRRVSASCVAGSSIRAIAADGSVTCENDDAGPANAIVQGGWRGLQKRGDRRIQHGRRRHRKRGDRRIQHGWRGQKKAAIGSRGTVGGGSTNDASGSYSTVGGGFGNNATGFFSMVGGGFENDATGDYSTVGGGVDNEASGHRSMVGGGTFNTASGLNSTVVGGLENEAAGNYSVAMGRRAKALGDGSFSFAGSNNFDFSANSINAFRARGVARVSMAAEGPQRARQTLRPDGAGLPRRVRPRR